MRTFGFAIALGFVTVTSFAAAGELFVQMREDEKWWGLCSFFGREMPFTVQSDFCCDLRKDNYSHQTMSVLVSDQGRAIWCEEPVDVTISKGLIHAVSDKGGILLWENVGRTLGDAYRYASRTWFPPSGDVPELLYFSAPQYNTWIELTYHQNERDVLAYAQSMIDHGLPPGIFMIDDTWQLGYGVWEFDPRRFSDPKGMMAKLHAMGYKVLLWMCPYVSMDSPAYRLLEFGQSDSSNAPQPKGGFLMEPKTGAAAAVKWWNGRSAHIDFTHPNGMKWFMSQLDRLKDEYGVDGFKFDGGGAASFCGVVAHDESVSPAAQSRIYGEVALRYRASEFRNSFGMGGKPVIMRLLDKPHTWEALGELVPDMLAAGLLGSPFICPDMIGGGSWKYFLPGAPFDPELFIRSAQVHALCPMMQISASPWRVLDMEHQKIFRDIIALRQKFAPYFVDLARQAAQDGEPMMRNLEYSYPGMGYAFVRDEFLMGTRLLVAPQTVKGAYSREIQIPTGKWRADDGALYEGPVKVLAQTPLARLPYFVKEEK